MTPRRPVTLEDVARKAGVSISTVSYALSGKGRVAESTKRRVQAVAKRVGYEPNAIARSLRGGRTGVLAVGFSRADGLPTPSMDVDYFNQTLLGVTAEAFEHGYTLVFGPPTRRVDDWLRLPLDGVVIFDPVPGDPLIPVLRQKGTPLVIAGRNPEDSSDGFWVDNDHAAGTRDCLDHLRERGAERIALLAADLNDAFTKACVESYTRWCRRAKLKPSRHLIPVLPQAIWTNVKRLLDRPDRPDGIYANTEPLGIAVLRVCAELGLRVPQDVMVVACTDRSDFESDLTPLTTLNIFPRQAAQGAVALLVALVEGEELEERHSIIPTQLVVRESTARTAAHAKPRSARPSEDDE